MKKTEAIQEVSKSRLDLLEVERQKILEYLILRTTPIAYWIMKMEMRNSSSAFFWHYCKVAAGFSSEEFIRPKEAGDGARRAA